MALAMAQSAVSYTTSGIAWVLPKVCSAVVYAIPNIYYGASSTASGIATGVTYVAPGVSRAVALLPATIGMVALTALTLGCCYAGVKSGAFKASLKLAGKTGKLAVKTGKAAAKVAPQAGKAAKSVVKTTASVGAKHVAPITWSARDLVLTACAMTYITWQTATLPQQVLIGVVAGVFIRAVEYKLSWNQWSDDNPEGDWVTFSRHYSHDLAKQLPVFGERNLMGIPSKALACSVVYAAAECVKKDWIVHPYMPHAAGAVMGYQLASFALNLHLDCITSTIRICLRGIR